MLSDDSGLGKTVLTLDLEARRKRKQQAEVAAGGKADIKPSVILCPARVLDIWIAEYERFFTKRFKLLVLDGPEGRHDSRRMKRN